MINTVNIDGKLALHLRCDWCGQFLGVSRLYMVDLLNCARERGWHWVSYDMRHEVDPYRTCHYCCEACQARWERKNRKAERRGE